MTAYKQRLPLRFRLLPQRRFSILAFHAPVFDTRISPMRIRRVVPNIKSKHFDDSRAFYIDLLGFKVGMDLGFIVTLVSPSNPTAQISLLQDEAGCSIPCAHLSIEVENVDEIFQRANALGLKIIYPLTDEPWGVRRFYVADPNGTVLNVMSHLATR
jgi:catechol 2,3-dioxygenase-like lactoylglutathione lyase family enzyme